MDFWITLSVMTVVLLVVTVIKCIPKYNLPYCLGGTKNTEQFVCFAKYHDWCRSHNLVEIYDQNRLANKTFKDKINIANETLRANNLPPDSIKPGF